MSTSLLWSAVILSLSSHLLSLSSLPFGLSSIQEALQSFVPSLSLSYIQNTTKSSAVRFQRINRVFHSHRISALSFNIFALAYLRSLRHYSAEPCPDQGTHLVPASRKVLEELNSERSAARIRQISSQTKGNHRCWAERIDTPETLRV